MRKYIFQVSCALLLFNYSVPALSAEIQDFPLSEPGFGFISIFGTIEPGDQKQFTAVAMKYRQAAVLLRSNGGNLLAGLAIGRTIRMRNFDTGVAPNYFCASACALIWIGGRTRYMSSSSFIGFHAAYSIEGNKKQQTGLGNALIGAYLTELGLPIDAVIFATKSGPDELSRITPNEAQKAGIDLKILDLEPSGAATATPRTNIEVSPTVKPNQKNYYYVSNTVPPDPFLALRTEPSETLGRRIIAMPNGTELDVIERRTDGWWHVKVISTNKIGWAKSGQNGIDWIVCCANPNEVSPRPNKSSDLKLTDLSCEKLWFGRNSIFKLAGYCFKTAKAVEVFGNEGCQFTDPDQIVLAPDNRSLLDGIKAAEITKSCLR